MQAFYSDTFALPLFASSRFPLQKYRLLREHLQDSAFGNQLDFRVADAATDEQLLPVHTPEYLEKIKIGALSPVEQRRIGFPWSPELVERSRRSAGGTIGAAKAALRDGRGAHLAGGTHHAFADRGQGYCVFNDVAVAVRLLQGEGQIRRALVIDLDVHQGNGTAAIFANDPDVFTFSMHGERNFPFNKCDGDLDIALPDGTCDSDYLAALRDAVVHQLPLGQVDLVFYLAGADPYKEDRFGKLKLTKAGLIERDRMVSTACRRNGVPLCVTMAGGYSNRVEDIVDIHAATIGVAIEDCR